MGIGWLFVGVANDAVMLASLPGDLPRAASMGVWLGVIALVTGLIAWSSEHAARSVPAVFQSGFIVIAAALATPIVARNGFASAGLLLAPVIAVGVATAAVSIVQPAVSMGRGGMASGVAVASSWYGEAFIFPRVATIAIGLASVGGVALLGRLVKPRWLRGLIAVGMLAVIIGPYAAVDGPAFVKTISGATGGGSGDDDYGYD
jgi:hypothetical protein